MRIAMNKQSNYIKQLSYAALSAGTTGDVWFEDDQLADFAPDRKAAAQPAAPRDH